MTCASCGASLEGAPTIVYDSGRRLHPWCWLALKKEEPMNLTFSQYQQASARTMAPMEQKDARLVLALGLVGEAGEVADLIKKHEGHGHPLDRAKLAEELADELWYLAAVATTYGIDLGQAAYENIEKLRRRYPEGFSTEASVNRLQGQGA